MHGSAPDIYGRSIANPVGMIWAGQMLLLHLGEEEAAADILSAMERVLGRADPSVTTPDIGGNAKTQDLGTAIEKAIMVGK